VLLRLRTAHAARHARSGLALADTLTLLLLLLLLRAPPAALA